MELLRQYFHLIHERERVSYLILQQTTIEDILNSAEPDFALENDLLDYESFLGTELTEE